MIGILILFIILKKIHVQRTLTRRIKDLWSCVQLSIVWCGVDSDGETQMGLSFDVSIHLSLRIFYKSYMQGFAKDISQVEPPCIRSCELGFTSPLRLQSYSMNLKLNTGDYRTDSYSYLTQQYHRHFMLWQSDKIGIYTNPPLVHS